MPEPGIPEPLAAAEAPRVLVVTNDFPPRFGGVQQYVANLVARLPSERVAVLAPTWAGARAHDAGLAFPVERHPSTFLWPDGALARRVRDLAAEHGAEVVLFGHGFPLPLLAPGLAAHGIPSVVLTHGAEVWIARSPALGAAFRRGLGGAAAVTAISRYTARALAPSIPPGAAFSLLWPAVDERRFAPSPAAAVAARARLGLGGRPMVLCVSRLVPRKGQDVLIRAMKDLCRLVPEAVLVVAGDGPDRPRLLRLAEEAPPSSVAFAGAPSDEELPGLYGACDVFAMPCRSRWGGLEVEGFGIVYLEAAAAGKPVVAGRSGGAGEAIEDEGTGLLVEGREPKAVALALARLLSEPGAAARMGGAGRARVEADYTWDRQAARLVRVLAEAAGRRDGSERLSPGPPGG